MCGTTNPSTAALQCAKVDLPVRADAKRVRCPDGVQREAVEGDYVSLGDICREHPMSREEAALVDGASCAYGSDMRTDLASRFVGEPGGEVTLEVIRR